jgi:transaldolase
MTATPPRELAALGQSAWIDDLSTALLEEGRLARLIREYGVSGVTCGVATFARALSRGGAYDERPAGPGEAERDPEELFVRLAARDVRRACNLLMATWLPGGGRDGHVSMEVDPTLAGDAAALRDEGERVWGLVRRPNLLVAIPATPAGLAAGEDLLARGRSVNFTLIASPARHLEAAEAHLRGIERLVADGGDPRRVASVASYAVARIDREADRRLDRLGGHDDLRGRLAVASARLAHRRHRRRFEDERWRALAAAGARPQRSLWAADAAPDPIGRNVRHIEELIGAETIAGMPEHTLRAFVRRGRVAPTLEREPAEAERVAERARRAGVDLEELGDRVERDAVTALQASFRALLERLRERPRIARGGAGHARRPGSRVVVLRSAPDR